MVALVSTSKTRTKLTSEEDAAIIPEGCAATAATPKECPVLNAQKRLAASVMKCGKGKVWLDPSESRDISMANSTSQVFYLHFALKKRAFIEEIHEKQEQVKEWLQNLGIGDHAPIVQDEDVDEVQLHQEESAKNRDVPSSAALPVIRPLGRQQSISVRGKHAMQEYLNHFLGNLDIVNSREVCRFLEVSMLSFSPEYGPKLKEDYIMVKHLPKISKSDDSDRCCGCCWFCCCNDNWQKVWGVLKPGFLALLEDPFDPKLLDIIVFDVLPVSNGNDGADVSLAVELKDHNPLRHAFKTSGTPQRSPHRHQSAAVQQIQERLMSGKKTKVATKVELP
ncbi:hypothetical protein F2Q70_00023279 [Brassica cretica]|uniref:Ribosomal protein L19 n=1 Tax=Brassica cretica TaxID=69181 RepID=A0A8S9GU07_BRACR|nr:hypothetical protein F2Q70_00023279 [Brassica cretica]